MLQWLLSVRSLFTILYDHVYSPTFILGIFGDTLYSETNTSRSSSHTHVNVRIYKTYRITSIWTICRIMACKFYSSWDSFWQISVTSSPYTSISVPYHQKKMKWIPIDFMASTWLWFIICWLCCLWSCLYSLENVVCLIIETSFSCGENCKENQGIYLLIE